MRQKFMSIDCTAPAEKGLATQRARDYREPRDDFALVALKDGLAPVFGAVLCASMRLSFRPMIPFRILGLFVFANHDKPKRQL
jgi:hypothetical protein